MDEEQAIAAATRAARDFLATLPRSHSEKEAVVVALRFGPHPRTLAACGKIVGVSGGRVRQIEQRALRTVRNALWSGRITVVDIPRELEILHRILLAMAVEELARLRSWIDWRLREDMDNPSVSANGGSVDNDGGNDNAQWRTARERAVRGIAS